MNLLPKEIIPTVLCYTLCADREDVGSKNRQPAEIAICNASGYLLEFSNHRIINSCYILIEDAAKLQFYCHFEKGMCSNYYLVRNRNGLMVVVKKWSDNLMVVGCYKNIRDCKIFDFKNKGHPQLGVYHFDSANVQIMSFSEFDNYAVGIDVNFTQNQINNAQEIENKIIQSEKFQSIDDINDLLCETDEEIPSVNENKNISDFFSKKLLAVEQYNNELNYEIYKMDAILRKGISNDYQTTDKSFSFKFAESWSRIHLSHWILGVEFWSLPIQDINEIKIIPAGRDFTSYAYRFFTPPDETGSNAGSKIGDDEKTGNVSGDDPEAIDFSAEWKSVSVGKTTSGYPNRTKSIAVAEDLMACLVVREETCLTVEMKYNLGISLEDVLMGKLGFSRAKILGEDYFFKENGDFCGTSISVKRNWEDLISWNLRVSATNENVLRILIGVIYNELPMPVRIRLIT